ncbi:MAG: hypothetical protein RL660_2135 [Bacteroidota bacterium]|jgi:acyl carrier protein phosphodiesterase
MNYLAHAYLNGSRSNEVLMGNMMGDFVKGKQFEQYSADIQAGIKLHRAIDTYTDTHSIVSEAKKVFAPVYAHYSGVLVDVMWDYFLANDTSVFPTEQTLASFTQHVYAVLGKHDNLMTERMAYMTSYMIKYDWLYNYRTEEGIASSWRGMSKRIEHLQAADEAISLFAEHRSTFRSMYEQLRNDLQKEFL